jgi:hypothetical protein
MMRAIAGFTGTQKGMTPAQAATLEKLMKAEDVKFFHHGDCIGADAQAHNIALKIGADVILHPPKNETKRAFSKDVTITFPSKEYLDRNHDIVDFTTVLFATPGEPKQKLRSGTWATIRYAEKKNKKLFVIFPDGDVATHA